MLQTEQHPDRHNEGQKAAQAPSLMASATSVINLLLLYSLNVKVGWQPLQALCHQGGHSVLTRCPTTPGCTTSRPS
jgi:hypothetical protein